MQRCRAVAKFVEADIVIMTGASPVMPLTLSDRAVPSTILHHGYALPML